MSCRRVLLLFDFSLSAYAANYAVVGMQPSEPLDVVLLVVGFRRRFPAPRSVRGMAENLANLHRARGGSASVRFSDGRAQDAVDSIIAGERFDIVVMGSELAPCLGESDLIDRMIVEPAGGPQARREVWPKDPPAFPCSDDSATVVA